MIIAIEQASSACSAFYDREMLIIESLYGFFPGRVKEKTKNHISIDSSVENRFACIRISPDDQNGSQEI